MPRKIITVVSLVSAALLLTACFLMPSPPDTEPSIRGTITSITLDASGLGTLLVEAPAGEGLAYDKASVAIVDKTQVLLKGADGWGRFSASDLKKGDTVEVWFTGAVAESYPVQATADTLVVSY
ncbi:MAG: hypothetical protein CVT59_03365 [Actinobacteria bacterium HGW-Actinobacteria-1]|jgi:hypothetical protein|nr:MAG: hypothetical protein CVT59_03365 [Actinobacteria bacterium HGW-Actinobacteria-1]